MKSLIILLLHLLLLNNYTYSQSLEFNNTISIFRLIGTKDSILVKDNFYIFTDTTGYSQYIDFPFRENLYFDDFNFSHIDSATKEYEKILRYEPLIPTSPPFKFKKQNNNLFLNYRKNEKIVKELFFNFNQKRNTVQTGFLGDPFSFSTKKDEDIIEYFGEIEILFRNKNVRCYKFSESFCSSSNCITQIIYLDKKNLVPIKYEKQTFSKSEKKISERKETYILSAIMQIDYEAMKGLHIWGNKRL